jgi:predicted nucleic acid-binding protein
VRRIFWDTMIHAYWLEDHRKLSHRIQKIHDTMVQRGDILCSSLFVLGELLVGPLRTLDLASADLIEQYFRSDAITLLPYTPQAVRTFAVLRAQHGVNSLDALHLAAAATAGVDLFLTNDRRLHKLIVPGISFIASLDTELF